VPIPEQIIPDFMVKDSAGNTVYIEFWGMIDDPNYKTRMTVDGHAIMYQKWE
jgi:hypothetical protein